MHQSIQGLPEELKQQNYWLLGNKDKIPVLPNSHLPVKGNRLDHCKSWAETVPFLSNSSHQWAVYLHNQQEPYTSIDLDKARDPITGNPLPWCQHFFRTIQEKGGTRYIEVSSSGTGYHILCEGKPTNKRGELFGKRLYHPTEERGKTAGKIEVIAANNLITYTGNVLTLCTSEQLVDIQIVMQYLNNQFPDQFSENLILQHPCQSNTVLPDWRSNSDNEWLDRTELLNMLDYINPDCDHDQWKQIGMAIHDWAIGSQDGREIWNQWSSTGSSYNQTAAKNIISAWKSFKPGRITVATLVQLAKNNGWQRARKPTYQPTVVSSSSQTQTQRQPEDNRQENAYAQHQCEKIIQPEVPTITDDDLPQGNDEMLNQGDVADGSNVEVLGNIKDGVRVIVERYNRCFVHTMIKGKNLILQLEKSEDHDQFEWDMMPVPEFKTMLSHEPNVPVSTEEVKDGKGKIKYQSAAQVWLTNKSSNFIKSTTFYPVFTDQFPPIYEGRLNLYRGLALQPMTCTENDTEIKCWLNHIKTVICRDNDIVYQYLLNWFAQMVQQPEIKPQTAIILKGGQGTGKNTAIEPILKIMGIHGLYVEKPGSVSGRFNYVLDNKIFVFADEAVFESKKDANALKSLITEKRSMLERKFIDSYSSRNFTRLLIATNEDNPVLISSDERRYLVLETSDQHKGDTPYFDQLTAAINGQLAEKLLYLLQQRDISQYRPHIVPKTVFLTESKINNLKPEQAFIYEALMNGSFISNGRWPAREETVKFQTWFQEWLDKKHIRLSGDMGRKLGKVITQIGGKKVRSRFGGDRFYQYELQELDSSRNSFVKIVMAGSVIAWCSEND